MFVAKSGREEEEEEEGLFKVNAVGGGGYGVMEGMFEVLWYECHNEHVVMWLRVSLSPAALLLSSHLLPTQDCENKECSSLERSVGTQ